MKKIFLLLLASVFSGIFLQTQAKTKTSGEEIFIRKADKSLELIDQSARKISIKGVAIVAFIPEGEPSNSWISKMRVVGHLADGKNNLLGIAYTKASEMAETHLDSGSGIRPVYSGELGYKGGLIKKVKSGYILAVFSGGSSDQDLEVAKIGLDWLSQYF
jgi:hypothetical protein